MSINNINNLPNLDNSVNRVGTNASTNTLSSDALAKGDYDYFSEVGGKATLITAKEQFGPGTIDDMAKAIADHVIKGPIGI